MFLGFHSANFKGGNEIFTFFILMLLGQINRQQFMFFKFRSLSLIAVRIHGPFFIDPYFYPYVGGLISRMFMLKIVISKKLKW